MKICSKCGKEKDESKFSWKVKSRSIRQSHCKDCQRVIYRGHYDKNRDYHIDKSKKFNTQYRIESREFIRDYLSTHPCMDCGNPDIRVLEFDHVKGRKIDSISNLIRNHHSLKKIKAEVEKCEVRCANCHRIRTLGNTSWRS